MKKKLLSIALALMLSLSFAACAAQDLTVSFDEVLPWDTSTGYEKSTYKIERYTRVASGKEMVNGTLIASGEYTTTIAKIGEDFVADATFTLTYNDSEEAKETVSGGIMDNRGLTDSFTAQVKFNKGNAPTYSEKIWTCATRPEGSKQMSQYSYTMDYVTNVGKVTQGDKSKDIAIGGGTRFDNEQMQYITRAMSGIAAGGAIDFYNVNPFDSYITNTYVRYPMRATCGKTTTGMNNDTLNSTDFLLKDKEGELKVNTNKAYDLPCLETTIAINDKKSGPAIKLWIIDPSISISQRDLIPEGETDTAIKTKKIIVSMLYLEYDVVGAGEKYNTAYTLTDYQLRAPTPQP